MISFLEDCYTLIPCVEEPPYVDSLCGGSPHIDSFCGGPSTYSFLLWRILLILIPFVGNRPHIDSFVEGHPHI